MSDDDGWEGYDSQFMFPGEYEPCTCEHESVDHDYESCTVPGCSCQAYWEHT